MGHYLSEMQCNDCGRVRCECKRKPDPEPEWTINDKFEVVHRDTISLMYRSRATWFYTKEAAENMVLPTLEDSIKMAQERIEQDKKRVAKLKDLRKKLESK
jgi:hypothetical protein